MSEVVGFCPRSESAATWVDPHPLAKPDRPVSKRSAIQSIDQDVPHWQQMTPLNTSTLPPPRHPNYRPGPRHVLSRHTGTFRQTVRQEKHPCRPLASTIIVNGNGMMAGKSCHAEAVFVDRDYSLGLRVWISEDGGIDEARADLQDSPALQPILWISRR